MAGCDVFQLCRCLKAVGRVMALIVLGIVGLSWYAAVVLAAGPRIAHGGFGVALLNILAATLFTFLVGMLVWSYFAAVWIDPGRVPAGWHPFTDEEEAVSYLERVGYSQALGRRDLQRPRYCKKCNAWKPQRAHHCSVAGRCVLRMDHYCIWVLNTVGLLNYKAFLLFLAYTAAAAALATALLGPSFVAFFSNLDANPGSSAAILFIAFVLDAAFSLSLAGFLAMHARMLARNVTTIEMYEKGAVRPWPYDRGVKRNFEEVFGRERRRWWLPYHTPEESRAMLEAALNPRTSSQELRLTLDPPSTL